MSVVARGEGGRPHGHAAKGTHRLPTLVLFGRWRQLHILLTANFIACVF